MRAGAAPSPLETPAARDSLQQQRARVWNALLAWYASAGRTHLPWRHTRDPYAILVSEVMLQQTQVERVLPKYAEWMARFPTLAALAAAPVAEAISAWDTLGYNLRAVRLHQIACQAIASHNGQLPATLEGLLALKGIGRYTAGALACFAFGLPVATVDTNIRRVLWRVFRGIEPQPWPTDATATRMALELAEWALPTDRAYDWQQALMDLGATVCLSRRPLCARCPLAAECAAYAETARHALFPSGEALAGVRSARARGEERRVAESPATYAAQPRREQPFAGSTRYYRGRIVRALRSLPPGEALPLAALGAQIRPDFAEEHLPWLRKLVAALARDGLARVAESGTQTTVALP